MNKNNVDFIVCDECLTCYWYDKDDENDCDGDKEPCNEFIKENK